MSKQSLKTTINANIKQNGVQAITGQIMNAVLNQMVDGLADQTDTSERLIDLEEAVPNKLDQRVSEGWKNVPVTINNNEIVSSSDFSHTSSTGGCYTLFDVIQGERYRIKGWTFNTVYCGLFYVPTQRIETTTGAFQREIIVPAGVTKIGVNGRLSEGGISVEKWTTTHQTTEEFYQEIDGIHDDIVDNANAINNLRGDVSSLVYTFIEPATYVEGKFISTSRVESANANFNYGIYSVNAGEKYRIRGWNINSNNPLAFVYNSVTGTSSRLIYEGSSIGMVDEAIIPNGYDKLYVNGQRSQNLIVHKITSQTTSNPISKEEICVMPFKDSVGIGCDIARRMNGTKDSLIRFQHNVGHPNKFFDFGGISFPTRGINGINNIYPYAVDYYTLTDYIMPIVVCAVNNIDGDFPTNTSYFTGGFHAYGNATSGNVTATMRQISQSVRVDGVPLVGTEAFVYGNKVEIDVVNNLQGCNTEKSDGSGREILKQHIHIYADKSCTKVKVEFIALEPVKVYQMDAIGQYFPFNSFRLVGSKTKKGVYAKGTLQRPDDTDRNVCAIKSFNDNYFLECGINPSYAEGNCKYNDVAFNAQATQANKGYFHLIAGNPVDLAQDEMLSFEGYFDLGTID